MWRMGLCERAHRRLSDLPRNSATRAGWKACLEQEGSTCRTTFLLLRRTVFAKLPLLGRRCANPKGSVKGGDAL